MAWAAKEASASNVIALVVLRRFWDESGKVDTRWRGGLSTAQHDQEKRQ
jgi:hypothetical protein